MKKNFLEVSQTMISTGARLTTSMKITKTQKISFLIFFVLCVSKELRRGNFEKKGRCERIQPPLIYSQPTPFVEDNKKKRERNTGEGREATQG